MEKDVQCALATEIIAAHVEMEMVVMRAVIIRAEHSTKALARTGADNTQEIAFLAAAVPALLDADPAAIGEHKCRHIYGIGMGMFGKPSRTCYRAAAIATKCLNSNQFCAQHLFGCTGYAKLRPAGKFLCQLAPHSAQISYIELVATLGRIGKTDPGESDATNLAAAAAKILVGQGGEAGLCAAKFSHALLRFG
jgi:hypothetical protein